MSSDQETLWFPQCVLQALLSYCFLTAADLVNVFEFTQTEILLANSETCLNGTSLGSTLVLKKRQLFDLYRLN